VIKKPALIHKRTLDEQTLEMAKQTLVKMSHGGIYDQVGGGFHRYATDETWLVPHFGKMLYDNALLIMAYLEETLGKETAARMTLYFNDSQSGNFEGRNILNITKSAKTVANDLGIPENVFEQFLLDTKSKLYAQRNKRKKPLRDEKILTAWNGLMISAFARSGLLLGNREYIQIAKKAALFIIDKLYINGELFRSYKDGSASHRAYLDDYAFFTAAVLDLFEADSDPFWFETALALDTYLARHFEDTVDGGFFMTADDHEAMIAREKPGYDGALPSGNAIALMNLFRFYEFTTIDTYRKRAVAAFITFSRIFESNPLALTEMMMALEFSLDTPKAIVIVSPGGRKMESTPFLKELENTYLPNRILIQVEACEKAKKLARIIPIVTGKTAIGGKVTAYVCERGICLLPAHTPDDFATQIKRVDYLQASEL
jgi:uncharacterized protein YyaL (SSP411 family)